MKKLLALLLSLSMLLGLTACGGKTIEVTIPAGLMTEENDEETLRKEAEAEGFQGLTLNEDGSVTYTMDAKKHKEVMEELNKAVDEGIEDLLNGENAAESFEKIEYQDDLTELTVYADQEAFESSLDVFNVMALFYISAVYQLFNGADPAAFDVTIHMVNAETEEEFDTLSYRDLMAEIEAE